MASLSLALYSVAEREDPPPGAAKMGSGLPSVEESLMRALMQKMTMHWKAVDLSSSSFPVMPRDKVSSSSDSARFERNGRIGSSQIEG